MMIFGTVVDEHQQARAANAFGHQIEQALGGTVNPMKVLENDDERLVEAFAQEDALDSLEREAPPRMRVHAGERTVVRFCRVAVLETEQRDEKRQGIFQRAIEHQDFAADFFTAAAAIVAGGDREIVVEQFDTGR